MQKAIFKRSGRTYIVGPGRPCGSKEENERLRDEGKLYHMPKAYGRIKHVAWIEKDGKMFGRVRAFFADELEFID